MPIPRPLRLALHVPLVVMLAWAAPAVAQDAPPSQPAAAPAAPSQPAGETITFGVTRYLATEELAKAHPKSFTLNTRRPRPEIPPTTATVPVFSEIDGRRAATITFTEPVSLYGLPGTPGPLLRNGFVSTGPVQCAWVLAMKPDGSVVGLLADTPAPCRADFSSGITFTTDAPVLPILLVEAPGPIQALVLLDELTGRPEMPPRWALGYAQTAGPSQDALLAAADWLRTNSISAYALVAPTGPSSPLAFAAPAYPDPAKAFADLAAKGFRIIARTSPLFPATPGEGRFDADAAAGHWISLPDRSPAYIHNAQQWVLPDPSRAETRTWWADRTHTFLAQGVHGIDLGRSAWSFLPADASLKAEEGYGGPGPASSFLPALTSLLTQATREGFHGEQDNRRPVVLSDSTFVGSQRSSTLVIRPSTQEAGHGDVIAQALSAAAAGQPLVAVAIPQPGDEPASIEQWKRRIGVAALMPMVIGESPEPGSKPLPEPLAATLRQATDRRSRLIPYLYTLCFSAFFECQPILRPLSFLDPADPTLRTEESAFLLGPELLVVPRTGPGAPTLPPVKGVWRKLPLGEPADHELPDLYLRPGAILPVGPAMQHTGERLDDPITLVVNLDPTGEASGILYEDSGEGYAFYRNEARRIRYRAKVDGEAVFVRLSGLDGGLPLPRRKAVIRILTDDGEITGEGSERGTIRIPLPARP